MSEKPDEGGDEENSEVDDERDDETGDPTAARETEGNASPGVSAKSSERIVSDDRYGTAEPSRIDDPELKAAATIDLDAEAPAGMAARRAWRAGRGLVEAERGVKTARDDLRVALNAHVENVRAELDNQRLAAASALGSTNDLSRLTDYLRENGLSVDDIVAGRADRS